MHYLLFGSCKKREVHIWFGNVDVYNHGFGKSYNV